MNHLMNFCQQTMRLSVVDHSSRWDHQMSCCKGVDNIPVAKGDCRLLLQLSSPCSITHVSYTTYTQAGAGHRLLPAFWLLNSMQRKLHRSLNYYSVIIVEPYNDLQESWNSVHPPCAAETGQPELVNGTSMTLLVLVMAQLRRLCTPLLWEEQ